ncbi:MAG TPA: AMP-binding protein [Acidimicrobiales bacterium]|nr:AMP-binding protein [Acidimicrobiales bacterium]
MSEVSYGRRLTLLAEERGEGTAVVFAAKAGGEAEVSWAELERRANQMAHALADREVGEGDVVVVALPNSVQHLVASFGAWKRGASVLPLRYDLPSWERDRMLELAGAKVVVGDWLDAPAGTVTSADIDASADRDTAPPPDRVPPCARLIATSGSTGSPKIIVTPAPGLYSYMPNAIMPTALERSAVGAVHLTTSPLYHTNGFAGSYMPLLAGDRVVLMEKFDAARAVDLIERHRVTHVIMVPTMLQRVARLEGVRDRDLSSLERVLYGGAAIPEWVVRTWLELVPPERFWFSYGSSEGVGLCVMTGREWQDHPGATGHPVDCDLKILDAARHEVPVGEVGEIFMRPREGSGPTFTYLGSEMPEPTPDGFWSIGDMGRVDEDGFLYIADRRQDMIVSGGANVFPAEVEAALSEHPGVADNVVVGLPDPEWGRRVHAIVQPADPGAPPSAEELRAHCKQRLAAYKVPKSFEVVEALPRSAAGKVNRTALAAERTSDTVA